ncbi:MAG: nucleotide-binding protein [Lentimicrobium sp.]|nr:nucleotide-binding protein [Lentimicrobium sp.]
MKKILFSSAAVFSIAVLLFSLAACNRGNKNTVSQDLPPGTHAVSVIEVIQTSNYTYLQVFENNNKYWIAVAKREAKTDDVLYYTSAMEMKDFHSKELDRTFPSILFVQDPSETLVPAEQQGMSSGKKQARKLVDISVEPASGGITIAELYKNKSSYGDKKVKVRGVVVKYNENIMKKNWIHIQDGSESEGNFDLTVTTMQKFEEGSIVTFEGVIKLDKDFGSGYAYDVIMEDATGSDEKQQGDATL